MRGNPKGERNEYNQGLKVLGIDFLRFDVGIDRTSNPGQSGEEKKRWSEANRNILVHYLERTGKVGKEPVDEIGKVQ